MKTKIIYISGGEVFEMAQVRAAFDEVRSTLGLDDDTVLFGVPVDRDNALNNSINMENSEISTKSDCDAPEKTQLNETNSECEEKIPEINDPVIPILSVLGGGNDTDVNLNENNSEIISEPVAVKIEQTNIMSDENEIVTVSDISIDAEIITPKNTDDDIVNTTNISDMINDDAPVNATEKTLEQLLESMTPLREDMDNDTDINDVAPVADDDDAIISDDDNTDATLAQLASEFAETEDKIVIDTKTETHGKIGKLKNILPFKKSKREDSSLMGDLFGWAGIAANDEDFAMPGFFTTNASRKQGT